MFSRSVSLARHEVVEQVAHGRLARALGPARPLDLEREDRRDDPDEVGGVRLAAVAVVQPADDGAADRQVELLAAALARQHRPLVLGRRARHREHAARGVDHRDARVERAPARARDLGQPGAALDGLGDRSERGAEGRRQRLLRLLGHAANCRSGAPGRLCGPLVVRPDDPEPDRGADARPAPRRCRRSGRWRRTAPTSARTTSTRGSGSGRRSAAIASGRRQGEDDLSASGVRQVHPRAPF